MTVKIYTKTGDKGKTALIGGKRVSKSHPRIDLYGDVDELNSILGVVVSFISLEKKFLSKNLINQIQSVQDALFILGSNLSCEIKNIKKFKLSSIEDHYIDLLEKNIDLFQQECSPLKNFILPGGHVSASYAHVARSVCRRCERKLVKFAEKNAAEVPKNAVIFLNRLSDYLFSLARYLNFLLEVKDIQWPLEKSK